MFRIRRLYLFIIQTFLPVFMMTFAIVLFIFLMQFLWRYVEEFVGKGLDPLIIIELFSYAALNLIPTSLPLAILLASLISFGNMGEKLELLAIKAAGVSLLRAMSPLILIMGFVCVGTFYYQNETVPRINVKFRTLYISIHRASPALDIPEGSFYSGIDNYSIYVKSKNKITETLYDVIIYDLTKSFENMSVYVCDSAIMSVPESKDHLRLELISGQQFSNLKEAQLNSKPTYRGNQFVPYGRENFSRKTIIIPYDLDFNRMDESGFENSQISKNITQLNLSIDTMSVTLDSINLVDRKATRDNIYFTETTVAHPPKMILSENGEVEETQEVEKTEETPKLIRIDIDSVLSHIPDIEALSILGSAESRAQMIKDTNHFQSMPKQDLQFKVRMHTIEWHKKFSLSFACLIFFFIGAPLGAIIRKGGLGLPVVISVLLFIVYYIIDNIGYKMAREGIWEVWNGIWLSSFILFPLGVFLTYKAMNDSELFNGEAYAKFIRKVLFIKTKIKAVNHLEIIDITQQPNLETLNANEEMVANLKTRDETTLKDIVRNCKDYGYNEDTRQIVLSILKEKGAKSIDITVKTLDQKEAEHCYSSYMRESSITLMLWFISVAMWVLKFIYPANDLIFNISITMSVIYLINYYRTYIIYTDFYENISYTHKIKSWKKSLIILSSILLNPALFFFFRKEITKHKNNVK